MQGTSGKKMSVRGHHTARAGLMGTRLPYRVLGSGLCHKHLETAKDAREPTYKHRQHQNESVFRAELKNGSAVPTDIKHQ